MNITKRSRRLLAGLLLAGPLVSGLSACTDPDPPPPDPRAVGRDETRTIRNTEAIGYAGDAIADKVDGALDAHDRREAELEAADPAP